MEYFEIGLGSGRAEAAEVGSGGSGPVGGRVAAGGIVADDLAVDWDASFVSDVYTGRVALAGRGQSSGVSGYSIGLSSTLR